MSAQQDEAWFAAIEHGDIETVRSYAAAMSKVTDEQGVTSLMKAATKAMLLSFSFYFLMGSSEETDGDAPRSCSPP